MEIPSKRRKLGEENELFSNIQDEEDETIDKQEEKVKEEKEEEEEEEYKCSICLQRKENEAFADQCFHSFCFLCIFQWSHMGSSPRCPLCKQEFFSLIHNVKSSSEYKRFFLPSSSSLASNSSFPQVNFNSEGSNNNNSRRWGRRKEKEGIPIQLSSSSNIPFSTVHSLRRAVYLRRLKAIPLVSFGNEKDKKENQGESSLHSKPVRLATAPFSSQEFRRRKDYWEDKLRPWIVRELQALLLEEDVDLIVSFILSVLQKFDLDDPKCKHELEQFLSGYVDQFCHELINFANAPYPLSVYDKKVEYDYSQAIPSFKEKREAKEYNQLKKELESIDGKLIRLHEQKNRIEEEIKIKNEMLDKHLRR
eukprot:TRINITY_DN5321_c2_g2_i2.p1 TRINITY_DN5321_c2_g2~~TRINITY_DN5321_c2_g2_i2.p1  ORF type:complete len:364 (+),score=134.11 TRINITY_DN5321_c2_g2_i2:229-1320(+)